MKRPPCPFADELKRIQAASNHTAADAAATFDDLPKRTFEQWVGADEKRWPRVPMRWPLVEFYQKHAKRNPEPPAGRPLKAPKNRSPRKAAKKPRLSSPS